MRAKNERMSENVPGRLVNVTTAAAFLQVSRGTIYGLMNAGRLPWVQVLRRGRRIPLRALQDLAANGLEGGSRV